MEIINCNQIANEIIETLKKEIIQLNAHSKITLIILYTGNNPATMLYISNKEKVAKSLGINAKPVYIKEEELIEHIKFYNNDLTCHGIIVQLPFAKIKQIEIAKLINPEKDVDGFHPANVGKLSYNDMLNTFVPCTALGCLSILRKFYKDLSGVDIAIVGRSNIVGKPLAYLLTNYNATVTLAHSHTKNLKSITKSKDVVICAIGSPEFFDASYFNKDAIIIDVGINNKDDISVNDKQNDINNISNSNSLKQILCGDVNFTSVSNKVKAITPVPRGVGPLTIAHLMLNTFIAYKNINKI